MEAEHHADGTCTGSAVPGAPSTLKCILLRAHLRPHARPRLSGCMPVPVLLRAYIPSAPVQSTCAAPACRGCCTRVRICPVTHCIRSAVQTLLCA